MTGQASCTQEPMMTQSDMQCRIDEARPPGLPAWRCDDPVLPPRREEIHVYPLDGEAVLFDTRRRKMYRLNQTALAIWNHCDGQTTLRRAADDVGRAYDTPFTTMLDHAEELLALFSSLNLLDHGMA